MGDFFLGKATWKCLLVPAIASPFILGLDISRVIVDDKLSIDAFLSSWVPVPLKAVSSGSRALDPSWLTSLSTLWSTGRPMGGSMVAVAAAAAVAEGRGCAESMNLATWSYDDEGGRVYVELDHLCVLLLDDLLVLL